VGNFFQAELMVGT